jgi:hypothetical protein
MVRSRLCVVRYRVLFLVVCFHMLDLLSSYRALYLLSLCPCSSPSQSISPDPDKRLPWHGMRFRPMDFAGLGYMRLAFLG